MARYDSPDFAGQFPGGDFDPQSDAMTAGGSAGAGGVAAAFGAAGDRIPDYDPLHKPLIVSAVGSTYGSPAVDVSPDDVNLPEQTEQYKPGGFSPYTGGDISTTGAGDGVPRGPGNPNADSRHPFAGGGNVRHLGGRA